MDNKPDQTKPPLSGVDTAASPAKRTVEHWAAKYGMTPKILDQPRVSNKAAKLVPGRLNPRWQSYAEARAHHSWPVGQETTEAEFLAALDAPKAHVFR